MERWEHDPDSEWLSQGHAEQLAQHEGEPLPEAPHSQALALGLTGAERIKAAICRESGPRAAREAAAVIRRAGGGRIGKRAGLKRVKRGAAA